MPGRGVRLAKRELHDHWSLLPPYVKLYIPCSLRWIAVKSLQQLWINAEFPIDTSIEPAIVERSYCFVFRKHEIFGHMGYADHITSIDEEVTVLHTIGLFTDPFHCNCGDPWEDGNAIIRYVKKDIRKLVVRLWRGACSDSELEVMRHITYHISDHRPRTPEYWVEYYRLTL